MSATNPTLEEMREFAKELRSGDLFSNKYEEEISSGPIQPGERVVKLVARDGRDELLEDWAVELVQHPHIVIAAPGDPENEHTTSVQTLMTRYNRVPVPSVPTDEPEFNQYQDEEGDPSAPWNQPANEVPVQEAPPTDVINPSPGTFI